MEITESVIKYVDSDLNEQTLSLQTLAPEELLSVSSGYLIIFHFYVPFFFLTMWGGFGVSFQFRSCQKVIQKHPFSCFGVYFQRPFSWSFNTLCLLVLSHFHYVNIIVFRLALEKDPGYVRGLVLMGQTLLQKTQLSEATKYLELAISKVRNGS